MIVRVAIPRPLWKPFDYRVASGVVKPGARVRVPFGSTQVVGIAVGSADEPGSDAELKTITEVIDAEPIIGSDVFELIKWAADYYHHPLGEALQAALPGGLRKGAPLATTLERCWQLVDTGQKAPPLRAPRQLAALKALRDRGGWASHDDLLAARVDVRVLRTLVAKGLVEASATPPASPTVYRAADFELTSEQCIATGAVLAALGRFECLLLEGVTGSGKTEVYLQSIAAAIESGGQALVLIPEIALTPQTLDRFERRFGSAEVYHSGLTDRERERAWARCRSGRARVLIGTRSAIFVTFAALKLIVVDEEHDGSFKQQDGFRYSARDLAVKRAQQLGVPLLMGTATPALESLYNARRGRYRHLELVARPGASHPRAAIRLIDIRGLPLEHGLSQPLRAAIGAHLSHGNQVLLFINRRGYSPTYLCTRCGWCADCTRCTSRMTLHRSPPGLRCHHCGLESRLPPQCPDCGHAELRAIGVGTQRSEQAIAESFPSVPVLRIDRDTTRSSRAMAAHLETIALGEPAVLVGTQMLAKGHHFPNVTLVGVLNADAGFASADFRAPEHTAQLIIQVAGRAGRAERPGEVQIQTYQPDNPLLHALVEHGYRGFADAELVHRASAGLPPLRPMALLMADAVSMDRAQGCLDELCATLRSRAGVEVLGPAPAPLARRARRFRCQAIVLAADRGTLGRSLDELIAVNDQRRFAGVRWSIDVDPYDTF